MTTGQHQIPSDYAQLLDEMIAELRRLDALRTPGVEAAIRAVPRHVFLPEVTPEKAYAAEYALVTKRDAQGVSLSSVSASRIQAFMLEQADIRPGMRVLEIGSGGYNAALIAELVGGSGEVTTVDIDPEVVDRARGLLSAAGYGRVRTVVADGAGGVPEHGPYDRIVVTVEAADLAPAWVDQLAGSGRIVAPLRMRGLTRSVAFQRDGDRLVSTDYEVCGFVPMQGSGELRQDLVVLHNVPGEEVGLRLDGTRADGAKLREALSGLRVEAWSGVTLGRGLSYEGLDLWLMSALPDYALMAATRQARDRGVVASWSRMGVSTLLEGDASFAYLTMRPTSEERTEFEFGAVGHGPEAGKAASRLVEEIKTWHRSHLNDRAEIAAYRSGTSDEELPPGRVIERPAFRFTISWPEGR
ncbi:methyltransferase, FxLD system [Streptomyces albipurpureus]|uniref:Protein-L-isoaspartate O-methyltransferase n=1 Tax=Streptomyces albipurpureus TaxID=2897419 RepID=A0ABT0UZM3_9ACTN|nr:methyltransferase, FxLD system [Streptomyces sp. CWNU-1]MCM2393901.1 methyltransferase, FxLD system [Streptomyces sp. CWNU-1]